MNPVKFKECNIILAEDQPEYQPLPAHMASDGAVTSCWELSDEELEVIKKTKKVYVQLLTFGFPLQPQYVSVYKDLLIEEVGNAIGKA